MERLKAPVVDRRSGSRELARVSEQRQLPTKTYRLNDLPTVYIRTTDVDIPNEAWEPWIPEHGARKLRRALTPTERTALERRRDELSPAVMGYQDHDLDRVAVAISDMFGGYTSMRQTDEEAVAKLDSMRRVLAPFPAWAIEKACSNIQINGVWRDGKFDRRWPPNDSEVIDAIRSHVRLYEHQHRSAIALLSAELAE